ncbi:16S rRNA (guanine(966)-N(2))-methyltransferase RsmD [bacterium]|nr:MAG: 16S rRNA (guanine(966)-N(2))-methyltransferase RsmD [bacterium]
MRITGGALRSRRLVAPAGTSTRPTSDRVREALFSILAGYVPMRGARVLDLYAGTGALGFEAISRGADHVYLVDSAPDAVRAIRANADALGVAGSVTVVPSPVARAFTGALGAARPFDVVLVDPPYADVASGAVAKALGAAGLRDRVDPKGVVALEHASRGDAPTLSGFDAVDVRRYGDTAISFFVLASAPQGEASGAQE